MITAAAFLFGVVVGIAFLAVCNAWDRQAAGRPRPESLSERNHRLDAEAMRATRPTTSSRKSGRVRTGDHFHLGGSQ